MDALGRPGAPDSQAASAAPPQATAARPFPVRVGEVTHKEGWTVLVNALRHAAVGLEEASGQSRNQDIYFPPRGRGERQPLTLRGYVSLREIAGLVHYIADMLEP